MTALLRIRKASVAEIEVPRGWSLKVAGRCGLSGLPGELKYMEAAAKLCGVGQRLELTH